MYKHSRTKDDFRQVGPQMTTKLRCTVTRSQLMSRAWQLARLNRRTATSSLKHDFGRWLSQAWAEARTGNLTFWPQNFGRREALQVEINSLAAKDRWDLADYPLMTVLSAELRSLSSISLGQRRCR
jgi:hypothetical protein